MDVNANKAYEQPFFRIMNDRRKRPSKQEKERWQSIETFSWLIFIKTSHIIQITLTFCDRSTRNDLGVRVSKYSYSNVRSNERWKKKWFPSKKIIIRTKSMATQSSEDWMRNSWETQIQEILTLIDLIRINTHLFILLMIDFFSITTIEPTSIQPLSYSLLLNGSAASLMAKNVNSSLFAKHVHWFYRRRFENYTNRNGWETSAIVFSFFFHFYLYANEQWAPTE